MPEREMWGRAASPDSSRIIEIENSPTKLLLPCGGGVLMAGMCAAAAIPLYPSFQPGIVLQIVMYFGVIFFALCSVVAAWRLNTARGPVLTITPEGIQDTRVAAEFIIPWSAVRSIQTWEYSRQKIMVPRSILRSNESSRSPEWRAGRAVRTALWAPMASASRQRA